MSQDKRIEMIVAAARDVAQVVTDVMAGALDASERECAARSHSKYPSLRPHHLRVAARDGFEDADLPAGWRLGGDSRKSGQLLLVTDFLSMRLLKERALTYPGGVPVAGSNEARREYYSNRAFANGTLFSLDPEMSEPINTLLLWDYQDPFNRRGGLNIRVVHPNGPGVYGHHVPIDLSIPLLSDPGFYSELRFATDNVPEDFFTTSISSEENESAQ